MKGTVQPPRPGMCYCLHSREAHTHFRSGNDCAVCDCKRFRRPGSVYWMIAAVWIGAPILGWAAIILVGWIAVEIVRHLF